MLLTLKWMDNLQQIECHQRICHPLLVFKLTCSKYIDLKESTLTHSFQNHHSKQIKHPPQGFLMGVSGCPTKGGNLGVFQQARKFELSNSVGYYPHQKTKFSCPLIILHILKKRYLLQILDKFYQKFLLRHAFSVTQS